VALSLSTLVRIPRPLAYLFAPTVARILGGVRLPPEGRAEIVREARRLSPLEMLRRLRDVLGADLLPQLARLRVPTLVVHGARDTLVPLAAARDVAARIPGARLEVLREAAHLPYMSHPHAFNAFVGDFLLRHLPAAQLPAQGAGGGRRDGGRRRRPLGDVRADQRRPRSRLRPGRGGGQQHAGRHRDGQPPVLQQPLKERAMTTTEIRYTVDDVLLSQGQVLLIQRQWDPFEGMWAFPGGHVDPGEDSLAAAVRELREETGITIAPAALLKVGTFDKAGRDPRGPYSTDAYTATLPSPVTPVAADDARAARWWPLTALPLPLAFDHGVILDRTLARVARRPV
jgi:ADP-ribose pyrophosphatase YjhB (NUDIX family)